MSIQYRAGTTAGNATGGNLTINKPTGTTDGDILVVVLYREAGTWTLPSGWTQWGSDQRDFNNSFWLTVAWKRASSEGSSYVFNLSTTTWRTAVMAAFSGCVATGDPLDSGPAARGTNNESVIASSITTITDNAMRVVLMANLNGTDITAGTSGYSQGPQIGGCEIWYSIQSTAGNSGDKTFGGTSASDTGRWATFHLALKEATTGYDLLAVVGSFALVGQAAALLRALLLAANQASYALIGQTVGIHKGYGLSAGQANLTLSGAAVTFRKGYQVTTSPANFTLDGQAGGLLATRLLTTIEQGYILTGQGVDLNYSGAGGYTISAEQVNFTLTGHAAILQAQRTISSAEASFALAGQEVNLFAARLLAVSQASYTMTGEDALMLAGRTVGGGQASYVLAGQDVAYVVDYVVMATCAAYTLAGQDVLFDYSGIRTSEERVYQIDRENRLYLIRAEDRGLTVPAEARVYAITV